jgi:hypothetical protein
MGTTLFFTLTTLRTVPLGDVAAAHAVMAAAASSSRRAAFGIMLMGALVTCSNSKQKQRAVSTEATNYYNNDRSIRLVLPSKSCKEAAFQQQMQYQQQHSCAATKVSGVRCPTAVSNAVLHCPQSSAQ